MDCKWFERTPVVPVDFCLELVVWSLSQSWQVVKPGKICTDETSKHLRKYLLNESYMNQMLRRHYYTIIHGVTFQFSPTDFPTIPKCN